MHLRTESQTNLPDNEARSSVLNSGRMSPTQKLDSFRTDFKYSLEQLKVASLKKVLETKIFDFREDKIKMYQKDKELEAEKKLTKSLRAEIELLRKKIQQLEVEDGYKRLEIKSLKEANLTLDETNKRLTRQMDDYFEKQRRLMDENQTVYNSYMRMSAKQVDVTKRCQKVAKPRHLTEYSTQLQSVRNRSSDFDNKTDRPLFRSVLAEKSPSSRSTSTQGSQTLMPTRVYKPTIQNQIIHEYSSEALVFTRVSQKAEPTRGFSPRVNQKSQHK